MRLAFINPIRRTRRQIGIFKGLDKREVIEETSFADMKNMSSDFYPAAGPRKPRGEVIKTLASPNGLYWKNGLAYVDGKDFIYEGEKRGEVTEGKKVMEGIGAYIVIFPDKVWFNTHSGEFGPMEKTFIQEGEATFEPTYTGSVYTKISCKGIGKEFSQWDGVEITGCTNEIFNKTLTIQAKTEDSITVIGALEEKFTQKSGISVKRKVPDMDFLTECENRLWGCSSKNHEIYASKLGDPLNWNVFEGIATDSYAATVGSDGDFTGAATYAGYALFFKEHTLHKVYGNKPSNIQINTMETRGVREGCEKSLCVAGETLFYLSREGVSGYSGGVPFRVSEQLEGMELSEGVAGKYGGKYYLSAKTQEGIRTLVYEPEKRLWHLEDETEMKFAASGGGELYYVDSENQIRTIIGDEGIVEWFVESGDQEEGSLNKKYVGKLQFLMELERGSRIDIFIKHDTEAEFKRMMTVHAEQKRTYSLPVKPKRCFYYRWRIEGRGKARLFAVGKYIEEGSEV